MTKFQSTLHQVIFNLRAKSGNQRIGHVCTGVLNEENPAHSVSRLGCPNQKKTGSGLDHNLKRLDCGCGPCYFWQHQLSVITNQISKNWLGRLRLVATAFSNHWGLAQVCFLFSMTMYSHCIYRCACHTVWCWSHFVTSCYLGDEEWQGFTLKGWLFFKGFEGFADCEASITDNALPLQRDL